MVKILKSWRIPITLNYIIEKICKEQKISFTDFMNKLISNFFKKQKTKSKVSVYFKEQRRKYFANLRYRELKERNRARYILSNCFFVIKKIAYVDTVTSLGNIDLNKIQEIINDYLDLYSYLPHEWKEHFKGDIEKLKNLKKEDNLKNVLRIDRILSAKKQALIEQK